MSAQEKIMRLIAFILLFLLALFVLLQFDETITRRLTSLPDSVMRFFELLARMGESDWMLIPTLLVWALCLSSTLLPLTYSLRWKLRSIGAMSGFIFVSVALPGALAAFLKVAIGRARPIMLESHGTFHFTPFAGDWRFAGFPSGHATTALALAWALFFLFGKRANIAFVGAALIVVSRIVDSAHFATDVFAGTLLGSIGAILVHYWFSSQGWIFESKEKGARNRMLRPFER